MEVRQPAAHDPKPRNSRPVFTRLSMSFDDSTPTPLRKFANARQRAGQLIAAEPRALGPDAPALRGDGRVVDGECLCVS
jgi:hypothetical protein